jgi:hypothetical protein
MYPIRTLPPYFLYIHFNIILPSSLGSSKWTLLPFRFPDYNFLRVSHLPDARYMSCQSRPILFDHSNNIRWRVQITEFLIVQFTPPCCHFVPLCTNILLDRSSRPSGWHACFVFGMSRVEISALKPAILTGSFRRFPQSLPDRIVTQIRPQPLLSTSFSILNSLIILSFDAI